MCRRDGADAVQLVQTIPQGTGTDGTEAWHEGAATAHCEMDSRQVLHRSGNVVTLLATFFCVFILRYSAISVRACTKRKSGFPRCCTFALSEKHSEGVDKDASRAVANFSLFIFHFSLILIMILYVLKQNKNRKSPAFGKWFAFPVIEETIDLDALAEHMSNHNTPYSKGAIKGMLTDMVSCIKELLLEGKNVKIADLAIFSLGIKNNGGAVSEDVFTVSKNIKGVKLRARATGELIAKSLNPEATLKKASATSKTSGNGGTTPTGGDSNTGGSQNQSGNGSSQSGGGSQSGSVSQNGGSGSNTGGNSGSGTNTGGNSGSQSSTEQGQEGDYRLVIYKYGNGTSTVTDDSEQEINSNDQVHSGSNVNVSVVPVEGKEPIAKVNGNRITLTENDGTYTGSFQMPTKGTVLEINSEPDEWDYADQN